MGPKGQIDTRILHLGSEVQYEGTLETRICRTVAMGCSCLRAFLFWGPNQAAVTALTGRWLLAVAAATELSACKHRQPQTNPEILGATIDRATVPGAAVPNRHLQNPPQSMEFCATRLPLRMLLVWTVYGSLACNSMPEVLSIIYDSCARLYAAHLVTSCSA